MGVDLTEWNTLNDHEVWWAATSTPLDATNLKSPAELSS